MTLRQLWRAFVPGNHSAQGTLLSSTAFVITSLGIALTGCGEQQPKTGAPSSKQLSAGGTSEVPRPTAPKPASPTSEQLTEERLPLYELRMTPRDLAALEQNPHSNNLHPATFIANGEVYDQVKVRYRGAFARSWPKKPLKIFFNENKPFQGQRRLNLNSGWRDPAFVREALAYHVYAACGAPAPKSRMVRVHMNGEFRGLYVEVEQPDKAFVNRLNLKGASVYKASSRSNIADERDLGGEQAYKDHYEKETQKDESYGDLVQFCQDLARTKDVLDFFNRQVDLKRYINYLAATTLMQNWDGYNKNHFIVHDGHGSKKWFLVPWDLDRTFGDHWDWSFDRADLPVLLGTRQVPGVTGWNRLADRFFSHPALRSQFLDRLTELLESEFTKEKLFPVLDQLESQISAEAKLDRQRWGGPADVHRGIAVVKKYIEQRRTFLMQETARLRK